LLGWVTAPPLSVLAGSKAYAVTVKLGVHRHHSQLDQESRATARFDRTAPGAINSICFGVVGSAQRCIGSALIELAPVLSQLRFKQ
jgi:hypothetical protein